MIVVADIIIAFLLVIGQCKILNYVAEAHSSILVRSAAGDQQRGPSNSTDSSHNVKSNE